MAKDVVIYHADHDGEAAANVVLKAKKIANNGIDIEFISMFDYDADIDFSEVTKETNVYIVDFSVTLEQMKFLLENAGDVIWIDHHAKAFNKYDSLGVDIKGLRYNGVSGCELTYVYMYILTLYGYGDPVEFDPETDLVTAFTYLKYIGDRDVWAWKYGNTTKLFTSGLLAFDTSPMSEDWDKLEEDGFVENVIRCGEIVEAFKFTTRTRLIEGNGFYAEIDDLLTGITHKVLAFNTVTDNAKEISEFVDNIEKDVSIFVKFSFNGVKWSYTAYSDVVDVTTIAQSYGGGGHKGAAGFKSDQFLLRFISKL